MATSRPSTPPKATPQDPALAMTPGAAGADGTIYAFKWIRNSQPAEVQLAKVIPPGAIRPFAAFWQNYFSPVDSTITDGRDGFLYIMTPQSGVGATGLGAILRVRIPALSPPRGVRVVR